MDLHKKIKGTENRINKGRNKFNFLLVALKGIWLCKGKNVAIGWCYSIIDMEVITKLAQRMRGEGG